MGNCLGNSVELALTQSIGRVPPVSKKALLVGLNYEGTSAALKGCINDAKNFKNILVKQWGYQDVTLLTDKQLTRRKNVLQALQDFLAQPQDIMVWHYSGHGTQRRDTDGDEPDGKDEVLYTKYGVMMADDDINAAVAKLPACKKLVVIIDACHSGSILDLQWQMKDDGVIRQVGEKEIAADVILITGCRDNQVSMDIQGPVAYGALSNSLSQLLKITGKNITWKQLVDQLRINMRSKGYAQVSQLSCSKKELFDQLVEM